MADTRCANPEYQLDVDVMILEYQLYRAIEAGLKALKWVCRLQRDEDDTRQSTKDSADQAVQNFDILVRLFHHNHPAAELSEGTRYNVKILEFLVLLNDWLDGDANDSLQSADSLKLDHNSEQFRYEAIISKELRMIWMNNRNPDQDSNSKLPQSQSKSQTQHPPSDHFTLQNLMPRFLDLSAEVANCMGHVNDQWFHLAAEFMTQSVLETIDHFASHTNPDNPPKSSPRDLPSWLTECFAWGATTSPEPSTTLARTILKPHGPITPFNLSFAQQMLHAEHHTLDIFTDPASTAENPTWTTLRESSLSTATKYFTAATQRDESTATTILSRHPLQTFMQRLIGFVDGLLCLNMGSINQKPVLVQIEEGRIDGLSQTEFEAFLNRVGLKVSSGQGGERRIGWFGVEGNRNRNVNINMNGRKRARSVDD